jgi:hypothetical protein
MVYGATFTSKAPPYDWLHRWLAAHSPACEDKTYVRWDSGGELGKCQKIRELVRHFGYAIEDTGPEASCQYGPGERPHVEDRNVSDAASTPFDPNRS